MEYDLQAGLLISIWSRGDKLPRSLSRSAHLLTLFVRIPYMYTTYTIHTIYTTYTATIDPYQAAHLLTLFLRAMSSHWDTVIENL